METPSEMVTPTVLKLAKAQRNSVPIQIRRSQIDPAPYNPRVIDSYSEKKLEASLKKWGLVETLVWNKRIHPGRSRGILVGGHQRLKRLDKMEGYEEGNGKDYLIYVSVVDLDPKEERELNVLLNNPGLQGQYDAEALKGIVLDQDIGFSPEAAGFDPMELQAELDIGGVLTVDDLEQPIFQKANQSAPVQATVEGVEELAAAKVAEREKIEKIKQAKKQYRENMKGKDDTEFLTIVVFKDRVEQTLFMEAVGADAASKMIDGYKLMLMLGLQAPKEPG